MDKNVNLFVNDEKIGVIKHSFIYNDEANSGREICQGCLLKIQDFSFRVKHVEEVNNEYVADLELV